MSREPVLKWSALTGLVNALVVLLVSFEFVSWTPEQIGTIESLMIALGGLLVPVIIAFFPRAKVTPLVDPRDDMNIPLIPDPDA